MADEKREEGVYGENLPEGAGHTDRGIREETVAAHPQPVSDEEAANEVKQRGAESIESSQTVAQELDEVRDKAAEEAGSGGMGREGVPRNPDDATQGEFGGGIEEEVAASTPG